MLISSTNIIILTLKLIVDSFWHSVTWDYNSSLTNISSKRRKALCLGLIRLAFIALKVFVLPILLHLPNYAVPNPPFAYKKPRLLSFTQ